MLEIIEYGKDEYSFPSLVVLGCFDAIHAGHRELFKKAKLQAKINGLDLGVMMFRNGKGGKQVYSFEERVDMLKAYNVKFVLVIDYTPEFKQTMPLDFLAAIEEKVNVKAYMSGKDFRFGKGAKGKSSTLKNYAEDEENGVWYMPVKDVMSDGEKISTTLIKKCLDDGDVKRASELLGENFYVEGEVVEGAHRGTGELGFPTVNLKYPEWKYPVKHGVYKVGVSVDGNEYLGIANFGGRPTFGDDTEVLEVHIKDFEGDLYGKTIKVSFIGFMRNIVRFDDASALAAQLEQDKSALSLSDEEFFRLYPLEQAEPAVEEVASAELNEECAPPAEVFEGIPAVQPEAEYESAQPAEPEAEVVEEQEVAGDQPADTIIPAWQLLSERIEGEVVEVTPAEPVEEITEELPEVPEEVPAEEVEEVIGETPVEEVVEEVIEETPAEEIVEEAIEGTPAEEISEEVVDEAPVEEVTEEVVEETPIEEVNEDASAEEVSEELIDETPVEEETEEAAEDAPAEEVVEEIFEKTSVEESTDEVVEEAPAEEVFEEVVEETHVEEPAEEIVEETPVEETTEEVVEETPVEETTEEVVEETPAEETAEEVSEEIVEETLSEDIEEETDEEPSEDETSAQEQKEDND